MELSTFIFGFAVGALAVWLKNNIKETKPQSEP
jgi:hypothetical protein